MQSFTDNRHSATAAELSDLSPRMQDAFHDALKTLSVVHNCTNCGLSFALVASLGRTDLCNGVRDHYCEAEEELADLESISLPRELLPVLKHAVSFDPPCVVDHPDCAEMVLVPRIRVHQTKTHK